MACSKGENHQRTTSTEASTSSFSKSAIKAKTVKRVENPFPRRKKEVIKSLASKSKMKTKLGPQA